MSELAVLLEIKDLLIRQSIETMDVLSVEEAARYLKCAPSTVYKLVMDNKIEYSKPEGILYFEREKLKEYMLSKRNVTISEIESKANTYTLKNKIKF